ncbi:MAG: hypothetical protein JNL21_03290 [Myxococcales bacterium]|nr:hypothetical protein [Myxococcales bacterium]
MRLRHLWLASALVLGCGDDEDGSGGGGTSSATTTSSSAQTGTTGSTTTSGTTTAGTTTSSSSSSTSGTGGGCPVINCEDPCPDGLWQDAEGCDTCACAPPEVELSINGFAKPAANVTFDVMADHFIGGIDRWVFNFTWTYDDPLASDDTEVVEATVRIMQVGPQYEPSETNATWYSPQDNGMPLEVLPGDYTLFGFAVLHDTLTPVSGILSIRKVGMTFEGGVWLEMQGAGTAGMVHAAGPFDVPVP